MSLPLLVIPKIQFPFEIPHMIHPFFVHLTIALPIVIIILELINLAYRRRTIGILSFFFMLLLSTILLLTYFTGLTDANLAKDFLTAEAKEALLAHKQLGIYLVYTSLLVLTFKLISVIVKKTIIRVLFFLVIIVFFIAVLNEGKKGGELVYKYGVNVKAVQTAKHSITIKDNVVSADTTHASKTKSVIKVDVNKDETVHTDKAESTAKSGYIVVPAGE